MALDREEIIQKAEKLLKQGKISGAIEEYARLVEDRPNDWNSANTLGDLYVKAGDMARAAEQFRRVADHLFEEGFLPRASAVYKKVLKVKSDDDHAVWRLADIAGRNGLGVDARAYYGRLIKERGAAGNERGVIDCIIKLGLLDDADVGARTTAAKALRSIGETRQAARVMLGIGDLLTKDGRLDEALAALREAADLDPQDQEIREKLAALAPPSVAPAVTEAAESPAEESEPGEPQVPVDVPVDDAPTDVHVIEVAIEEDVVVEVPEPLPLDSVFEALEAQVNQGPAGGTPNQVKPESRD